MSLVTVTINGRAVQVDQSTTILAAARLAGVMVPTLCHLEDHDSDAACRLCVVEVDGAHHLVPSCVTNVQDGQVIRTNTQRVLNARSGIVDMILARHDGDCLGCYVNGDCELQRLAGSYGSSMPKLPTGREKLPRDVSSPGIVRNPGKCVLCGRCVRVCQRYIDSGAIGFSGSASKTAVGPPCSRSVVESTCVYCGRCISVCPTGAIHDQPSTSAVLAALYDPKKTVVAILSATCGPTSGDIPSRGAVVSSLRMMGMDYVFDTSLAVGIIAENIAQQIENGKPGASCFPIVSSQCPAANIMLHNRYPELARSIAPESSPDLMMAGLVRDHLPARAETSQPELFLVSVSSCVARKAELRDIGRSDNRFDAAITMREYTKMRDLFAIDREGIDVCDVDRIDNPANHGSVDASGGMWRGVFDSLRRMGTGNPQGVYREKSYTDYTKYTLSMGKQVVNAAATDRLSGVATLLEREPDTHFLELMACSDDRRNGGQQ